MSTWLTTKKSNTRKRIKVVPNGPTNLTRGAGLIAEMDELAERVETKVATVNGAPPDADGNLVLALATSFADLLGQPGDNVALSQIIQQLATATDAQKQRIDALLQGADGSVDTFIEAYNRFVADETAAAALNGQVSNLSQVQQQHTQQLAALQALGGRFLGPWAAGLDVKPFDYILTPDKQALRYAPLAFSTGASYDATKWLDLDAVLTTAQVQAVQLLASPVVASGGGPVTPYATADAAFASGQPYIFLNQDVTLSNTPSGIFAGVIRSNGRSLSLAKDVMLEVFTASSLLQTSVKYASGTSAANSSANITMIGAAGGSNNVVTANNCLQVVDGAVGVPINVSSGNGVTARGNASLKVVIGSDGLLYLYDLSSVGANGTTATQVDRRPTANSGGSGPTYTAGAGIAISASNVISATGGGSGIDYANPVTLSAAATLQANKAYYVTGSSYQLTLPDASQSLGAAIFIQIAADATGLYPIAGGDSLAMYATETMLYRATLGGWTRQAPGLHPMVARLETVTNQQDYYAAGGIRPVPLSRLAALNGPAALAPLGGGSQADPGRIVIQRTGRGIFDFGGVINQLSNVQGDYTMLLERTPSGGGPSYPVVNYFIVSPSVGTATSTLSTTLAVTAGEVYRLTLTPGGSNSCALAGNYPTNVFFLNFTEIV